MNKDLFDIIGKARNEGWMWPQVYYYIADELGQSYPDVKETGFAGIVYGLLGNMEKSYLDYVRYRDMFITGYYREFMNKDLAEHRIPTVKSIKISFIQN